LGQRVLVYWATLTLGPFLLAVSISLTSYALSASKGMVDALPGGVQFLLDVIQFLLLAAGMAALYRFVPNTPVRWAHAWVGGVFVSVGFELAKRVLVWYLAKVPTYSVLYGAFATVPILLIWIYTAWVIVLLGAVIAAYLPSLLSGVQRRARNHGWQFLLALEILQQLDAVRLTEVKGLSVLQLELPLEQLQSLDWVAALEEQLPDGAQRLVLLANPDTTPLAPLFQALLLERETSTEHLWQSASLPSLMLRNAL
jgi:membrane protein